MSRVRPHTPTDNSHVRTSDVHVTIGGRTVLTGVTVTVAAGRRVLVVGENGAGKSTVLRVLAGELVLTPARSTAPAVSPWSTREWTIRRARPSAISSLRPPRRLIRHWSIWTTL